MNLDELDKIIIIAWVLTVWASILAITVIKRRGGYDRGDKYVIAFFVVLSFLQTLVAIASLWMLA